VEEDLDKIGDERMLKIILLDQLMLEYLMGVQENLLEENGILDQKQALALKTRDAAAKQLEENKKKIDELREEEGRKEEKLKNVKMNRQKVASFKCPYCPKMFKNLYYLEKHMVKNELSQIRLERNAELVSDQTRIEMERAKEAKRLEELAQEKKKELDFESLKKELEFLKNKQDQDHKDKQGIEDRLQKVNNELSKELKKFEEELAGQSKKLQEKQKSEEQTKAELEKVKQEVTQKLHDQKNLQPAQDPASVKTIQPTPASKQEAPAVAPVKQDPTKNPETLFPAVPDLGQLKKLIKMNIELNEVKGKTLVKPLQVENKSEPHSLIVDLVKEYMVQQKINPQDPVGDKPDQKKSMEVINLITNILESNQLLQAQPTIAQPVVQPAQQKGAFLTGDSLNPNQTNQRRPQDPPDQQPKHLLQSEETSYAPTEAFGQQLNQQNRKAIHQANYPKAHEGSDLYFDGEWKRLPDPAKFFESDRAAAPKLISSQNQQELIRSTILKRGDIQ